MPDYKVLNNGDLVEFKIDVDMLERGPGLKDALIQLIEEACKNLEDIFFAVESEIYNYGDSRSNELLIYGRPTGNLAREAKAVAEARRQPPYPRLEPRG